MTRLIEQDSIKNLLEIDCCVNGNESLFGDIFSSVGSSVYSGAKIVGGMAMDGVVTLFKKANKSLIEAYGSHSTKFEFITKNLSKDETEEWKIDKSLLSKISSTGKAQDIIDSLDTLIKELKIVDSHRLEIESYYHKELSLFQDFKSIKNIENSISVLKKLDDLKYPDLKFGNSKDSMAVSEPLPGGKEFAFDNKSKKYSLITEKLTTESSEDIFSKEDIKKIMTKLDTLEELYKVIIKANSNYISYLEKYNTVVKEGFKHLEELKDDLSISVIRDLQSRLEGNPNVFSFYTGFLPKVMSYIDDYINSMSSFISKPFN